MNTNRKTLFTSIRVHSWLNAYFGYGFDKVRSPRDALSWRRQPPKEELQRGLQNIIIDVERGSHASDDNTSPSSQQRSRRFSAQRLFSEEKTEKDQSASVPSVASCGRSRSDHRSLLGLARTELGRLCQRVLPFYAWKPREIAIGGIDAPAVFHR